MTILDRFLRRPGRPDPLRVENADAFSACLEKYGITSREGEIIRLLLEGKDGKDITKALFISDHTVKNHIHHIYQKLGIRNRIQLVQRFRAALEETGHPSFGPSGAEEPSPGSERLPQPRRNLVLPVSLAVILVAAGLIVWNPWPAPRRPAPSKPVLAVLDFENLTPDPDFDKWTTGFPLLLTTDLIQSKHIRTLTDDAVFGVLKNLGLAQRPRYSRDDLRRLAKDLKADYLLTGTLMKAGNRILVTAFLQDARTGDLIKTEKADCGDEVDLMRKADVIALSVKSGLRFTSDEIRKEAASRIETLTTSSPLAYKYYAEGRRYHRTGDYAQSLLMLKQAVALDPNFAMAYRDISTDYRNLDDFKREAEFMKRAFDLSENLPARSRERQLIRGDYYSLSEATLGQAAEAFKQGLEDRPEDLLMNNSLAMLDYDLEDYEAAVKQADIPIRQETDDPFPYHTKAAALQALGRFSEASQLLRSYHENHPANRLIFETLAQVLIQAKDFAGVAAVLDQAEGVFPGPAWAYWRGTVLFHTKGAAAASAEFRRLSLLEEATIWPIQSYQRLGSVAVACGRFTEAVDLFRKGAALADANRQSVWATTLHRLLGQALLDAGDVKAAVFEGAKAVEAARAAGGADYRLSAALFFQAEACFRNDDRAAAEALARQSEALSAAAGTKRMRRQHLFFRGMMEFEKGRTREALALFNEAAALRVRRDGLDFRTLLLDYYIGLTRERAGDPAGAAAAFEAIIHAPGDPLSFGGLYAKGVIGLARVEEKLAQPAAALEHYRLFLELWKDADPGRPEVEEAGNRVQALTR